MFKLIPKLKVLLNLNNKETLNKYKLKYEVSKVNKISKVNKVKKGIK